MVTSPTSLPPCSLSPRKRLAPHCPSATLRLYLSVCFAVCLIFSLAALLSFSLTASSSASIHSTSPPLPAAIANAAPVAAVSEKFATKLENENELHREDALKDTPNAQAARPAARAPASASSASSSDDDENPAEHLCPNLILISAARHGSTWLVDSASSCRYSRGLSGTYHSDVFNRTEIWTERPGPVEHISPQEALQYVLTNSSVKFMQPTVVEYGDRAEELLRLAKKEGIPVIVLRRRAMEAFRSKRKAVQRGDWRVTTYTAGDADDKGEQEKIDEDDLRLTRFVERLEKYFGLVDDMLERVGNTMLDRFDYDDIKDEKFIHARQSACYIRNCNFVEN